MIRRIDDLSIRNKFVLLYFLGVLVPIIVLVVFVLTNVTAEIRQREQNNFERSFDRVYSVLESQFTSVKMLSDAVISDSAITSCLGVEYATHTQYYSTYINALRPQITRYLNAYAQQLTAVELYTDNTTTFSGGVSMHVDEQTRLEPWFPQRLDELPYYVPYVKTLIGRADKLQISFLREFPDTSRYLHLLKIDMNMESIRRAMEREKDYLSLYLVAPDGKLACSFESSVVTAAKMRTTPAPTDVDINRGFAEGGSMRGWQLMAVVNRQPMQRSVVNAVCWGLGLGLMCSLFAAGLMLLFARSVVTRSRALLWHMDNTTPDRFIPITENIGRDEIGELTTHFNTMSNRLKQLINDVYVLELNQKSLELERVRGELKYLQAQIDPHFLFNTLNGILVICVRNGYTELTEIIRALSKLMRRMLDTSRDVVPLREELDFVTMVLKIEQFRFGDKLRYEFDIAEDVMDCPVPVMCVQGLVENACKHGVQHLSGQGVVKVRAWREGGFTAIDVTDNGVGVAAEKLAALRQSVRSQDDIEGSIGLQNIYRRLVLQYGHRAELRLDAVQPQGTVASIRIPEEKEGVHVPRASGGR